MNMNSIILMVDTINYVVEFIFKFHCLMSQRTSFSYVAIVIEIEVTYIHDQIVDIIVKS